jgi:uncharacterized protein (TIGR00290 family)
MTGDDFRSGITNHCISPVRGGTENRAGEAPDRFRESVRVPEPKGVILGFDMKTDSPINTVLAWSSGKDSAWALHRLRQRSDIRVVGLLTTINQVANRVAMHAVRDQLLDAQAAALGLPVRKVRIPSPCSNAEYETAMAAAMSEARLDGVRAIAFGDLFLEDVRRYREEKLEGTGIAPLFPIWGEETHSLADEMLDAGVRAVITCVDPKKLDRSFAGRIYDARFVRDLPEAVDPCGENGEFHSFAFAGPAFESPIPVATGEVVERDGFVFADVTLASGVSVDP